MRHSFHLALALCVCTATLTGAAQPPAARATAPTPAPSPISLAPGETVAPFDAEGLDGVVRHVAFPKGTTTILLFFSSGCTVCHRMIPAWNDAFRLRAKNLAVIGVVADRNAPPQFFETVSILFPVLRSPGEAFLRDYKVLKVPQTLRIAPGGRVEDVAVGPIDLMRVNQLFRQ